MSVESVSVPRYAFYYAPRPEEGLAVAADQWLGRNAETGQGRPLKPVSAFTAERLTEITADPRLYGFHGTLKAPIALADGVTNPICWRRSATLPSVDGLWSYRR